MMKEKKTIRVRDLKVVPRTYIQQKSKILSDKGSKAYKREKRIKPEDMD